MWILVVKKINKDGYFAVTNLPKLVHSCTSLFLLLDRLKICAVKCESHTQPSRYVSVHYLFGLVMSCLC